MEDSKDPLEQLKRPTDIDEAVREAIEQDAEENRKVKEDNENEVRFKKAIDRGIVLTYTLLIFIAILVSVAITLHPKVYQAATAFILLIIAFSTLRQYNATVVNSRAIATLVSRVGALTYLIDRSIKTDKRDESLENLNKSVKQLTAEIRKQKL